jgi:hypothetical protein
MKRPCLYGKNYSKDKDKKQVYSGAFKLVHHPCLPQSFALELHVGVCRSNVRAEEVDKCDELSVSEFHFYFLCRSNGMTLVEGRHLHICWGRPCCNTKGISKTINMPT